MNFDNLKILHDALPNSRRALLLRNDVNEQLKTSLLHLLQACDEVIDPSVFQYLTNSISSLDHTHKISPYLFMINYHFINAIQNDDIAAVHEIIEALSCIDFNQSNDIIMKQRDNLLPFIDRIFYQLAAFDLKTQPALQDTDKELFINNARSAEQALTILKSYAPDIYDESYIFLNHILFINGQGIKAGSSVNALGLMYIEQHFVTTLEDMIDMIVHESAHQYLHALSYLDEIVTNAPDERYEAPLRQDKRPLIGIYHAVFVLARITYVFKQILNNPLSLLDDKVIIDKINHYTLRYNLGLKTVLEHGRLTPIGADIINSTHKLIN